MYIITYARFDAFLRVGSRMMCTLTAIAMVNRSACTAQKSTIENAE
jgi:hypothetical protein